MSDADHIVGLGIDPEQSSRIAHELADRKHRNRLARQRAARLSQWRRGFPVDLLTDDPEGEE